MRKDLTGQRFGRLVAVEPTDKRTKDGNVVWSLKCDCGNTCEAPTSELLRGRVRSCGCAAREPRGLDLAGKRFGKLVAVRRAGTARDGSAMWECLCDCGSTCVSRASELVAGSKVSCGCSHSSRAHDLSGQRFGKLVAERPVGRRSGYVLWECKCDCGGTRLVTSRNLTGGKTKSCGCARGRGRADGRVAPGERYGSLTAISAAGETRDGSPVWRCMCDCDRVVYPTAAELLSGAVTSCGQCAEHGGKRERKAG